jgi:sulfur relay (sulfurtransferase) DsrC/TusE family protein
MYEERHRLSENELIAFIQGRKLIFHVPDHYLIEVIPPNYGITMSYNHWELIKSYLLEMNMPFNNIDSLIKMIEKRS